MNKLKQLIINAIYGKPVKGEPMEKERNVNPPAMPYDNISYSQWISKEWKNHFNKTAKAINREIDNNYTSNTLI